MRYTLEFDYGLRESGVSHSSLEEDVFVVK
jgi:hypothetical protein